MDRFRSLARKLVDAAALGLLASAILYLPPGFIAARLDAWLFTSWSQLDSLEAVGEHSRDARRVGGSAAVVSHRFC